LDDYRVGGVGGRDASVMMEAAMGLACQGLLSSEDIAFVTSVAVPGCLYQVPDPNFSILDPR